MNDRLKNYLALTAGFVAISPLADAQIIYTDVNPDSVLTGHESFKLDINKDGLPDLQFNHQTWQSHTSIKLTSVIGLNDAQILSVGFAGGSSFHYAPKPFNFGDTMISNPSKRIFWGEGDRLLIGYHPEYWHNSEDKYLGFRYEISGNYHFGWARLNIDTTGKYCTLKDYAYNGNAYVPVRAGVSKVSLPDDNPMKNIRVYVSSGSIRIEAPVNGNLTGSIRLSDIHGRDLKSVEVKNEKNVELNTKELPTGLYIVNILTEKGILNKKVLIR